MKKSIFKLSISTIIIWSMLLGIAYYKSGNTLLRVYFLDIDQGDATLIVSPENQKILIDGGPHSNVLSRLGEILPFYDKEIDLVILTHPHADHLDGLVEILKRYNVKNVLLAPVFYKTAAYLEFLETIHKKKINFISAENKTDFRFGENLKIDIIFPLQKTEFMEFKNLNNASVCLKLSFGDNTFLFTGDAEENVETILLKSKQDLKADIFQAGHHGSNTSNTSNFLKSINPRLVVISSGKENKFNHPAPETLQKLSKLKINVLNTQIDGTVKLECDLEKCSR